MTNLEDLSGNYEFQYPNLIGDNGLILCVKQYPIPLKDKPNHFALYMVFPDGGRKKISTIYPTKKRTEQMDPKYLVQSIDYQGYNYWLIFDNSTKPIICKIVQLGLKIPKDKLAQPNFSAK
jgi:hypothetical protein